MIRRVSGVSHSSFAKGMPEIHLAPGCASRFSRATHGVERRILDHGAELGTLEISHVGGLVIRARSQELPIWQERRALQPIFISRQLHHFAGVDMERPYWRAIPFLSINIQTSCKQQAIGIWRKPQQA